MTRAKVMNQLSVDSKNTENYSAELCSLLYSLGKDLDSLYNKFLEGGKKYYILNNRILSPRPEPFYVIARNFGVSSSEVEEIEKDLLFRIKSIIDKYKYSLIEMLDTYGSALYVKDLKCQKILENYYIALNKISSETEIYIDITANKILRVKKCYSSKSIPAEKIKIDKDTVKQVEQARKKLLDLTMRNSLLNFRHSERTANQVRLVNSNISSLYDSLIAGKDIELVPLPELPSEPRDEKTAKFQNAFEMALVTDEKYLAAKEELDKKDFIEEDEEEKLIRELKNRVREQLGLPPLNSLEITKREWALENGINPSYENEISETSESLRSRRYTAQTLLYPKEFKSRMQR